MINAKMEEKKKTLKVPMREILFRGKRLDNNLWSYGNFNYINGKCYIFNDCDVDSYDNYEIDPSTVGMYIGLTDKNGTKIFEGDIAMLISRNALSYGITVNAKFLFENGSFMVYLLDREVLIPEFPIRDLAKDTEITVIGNIHDDPELMKI